KAVEKQLEKLIAELRPGAEARVRVKILETLRADAVRLQAEVEELGKHKEAVAASRNALQEEARKADPANLQPTAVMDKLRNEISQTTDALANVNKEIAKLRVEPLAQSRAVVLQRAARPDTPDYSRQVKLGSAAGLGVFGVLLFGVALLEFRSRKVNSAT